MEIHLKKDDNSQYDNKKNINNISLLKDLVNDSYTCNVLDNTFIVIKSIDDILLLIYPNRNSIISHNILNNKKLIEIKSAHNNYISNFRHYLDEINRRDLILSISSSDNTIKLWNIYDWNCLLDIKKINNNGWLYSACFLNNNNQIYIVISHFNIYSDIEPIKIYDYKGNKIKIIKDSNECTYFVDIFYDIKLLKNYILTGNEGCIRSYDYNNSELYHKYSDNNNFDVHYSITINKYEENINLIESCSDGNIRIWDFHLVLLLNKIKVNNFSLYGICLWDKNYLFVGSEDKTIKLIDIMNKKIIKSLKGHHYLVSTLKKVIHPLFGECLISQEFNIIKIWTIKNI